MNHPQTNRQWHSICLTIVTISTASLGAVIAISGISQLNQQEPTAQLAKIALVLIATAIHFTLAVLATPVIFREHNPTNDRSQRNQSFVVYSLFILTIFVLGLLLASNIFLDQPPPPADCNCP